MIALWLVDKNVRNLELTNLNFCDCAVGATCVIDCTYVVWRVLLIADLGAICEAYLDQVVDVIKDMLFVLLLKPSPLDKGSAISSSS